MLVGDAELSAEPEGAEATARKKPKGNVKVNFNSEVEYLGPKDGSAVYVESEEQHLRRVLASSIVGNTLEWCVEAAAVARACGRGARGHPCAIAKCRLQRPH